MNAAKYYVVTCFFAALFFKDFAPEFEAIWKDSKGEAACEDKLWAEEKNFNRYRRQFKL